MRARVNHSVAPSRTPANPPPLRSEVGELAAEPFEFGGRGVGFGVGGVAVGLLAFEPAAGAVE
jgi:hypothetical protein